MIRINPARLENFKRRLKEALVEVKHTHRLEAMARGFGYRTYAALLADIGDSYEIDVEIDELSFADFLVAHGYGDLAAVNLVEALQIKEAA